MGVYRINRNNNSSTSHDVFYLRRRVMILLQSESRFDRQCTHFFSPLCYYVYYIGPLRLPFGRGSNRHTIFVWGKRKCIFIQSFQKANPRHTIKPCELITYKPSLTASIVTHARAGQH